MQKSKSSDMMTEYLIRMGTLEGHKVVGICGSGIFEVMVEMANAGLLDQSGLCQARSRTAPFQPRR